MRRGSGWVVVIGGIWSVGHTELVERKLYGALVRFSRCLKLNELVEYGDECDDGVNDEGELQDEDEKGAGDLLKELCEVRALLESCFTGVRNAVLRLASTGLP